MKRSLSVLLLCLCFSAVSAAAQSAPSAVPLSTKKSQLNSVALRDNPPAERTMMLDTQLNDKMPSAAEEVMNRAAVIATPLRDTPAIPKDDRKWSVVVNYGGKTVFTGVLLNPQVDGYKLETTKTTAYLSKVSKDGAQTIITADKAETGVKIFAKSLPESLDGSESGVKIFLDFEYRELLGFRRVHGGEVELPDIWSQSIKQIVRLPEAGEPALTLSGLKSDDNNAVILTIAPLFK